jgi:hypothetical protein
MSYKGEVIADSSGVWVGNDLRFESREEAERYIADLMWRWTAVRETRVVEVDAPATARLLEDGSRETIS